MPVSVLIVCDLSLQQHQRDYCRDSPLSAFIALTAVVTLDVLRGHDRTQVVSC